MRLSNDTIALLEELGDCNAENTRTQFINITFDAVVKAEHNKLECSYHSINGAIFLTEHRTS